MTDRDLQQKRYIAAGIDIAVVHRHRHRLRHSEHDHGVRLQPAPRPAPWWRTYLGYTITFVGSLVTLAYILGGTSSPATEASARRSRTSAWSPSRERPSASMESAKRNGIFAIGAVLCVVSATLGSCPARGPSRVSCSAVLLLGRLIGAGRRHLRADPDHPARGRRALRRSDRRHARRALTARDTLAVASSGVRCVARSGACVAACLAG